MVAKREFKHKIICFIKQIFVLVLSFAIKGYNKIISPVTSFRFSHFLSSILINMHTYYLRSVEFDTRKKVPRFPL